MSIGPQSDNDLQSIEIEDVDTTPSTLLENASSKSLKTTYIMFFCFIILHIYSAIISPPTTIHKESRYSTSQYYNDIPLDFEIFISTLTRQHRYADVSLSLIRNKASGPDSLSVTLKLEVLLLKDHQLVKSFNVSSIPTQTAKFSAKSSASNLIPVINQVIDGFDEINIKTNVETNFSKISSVVFKSSYYNPNYKRYNDSLGLLNTILVGYILFVFFSKSTQGNNKFYQVISLILGTFAIVASNPLSFFISSPQFYVVVNPLSISLVVSFFRFTLMMLMKKVRSNNNSVGLISIIFNLVIFTLNFFISSFALNERFSFNISSKTSKDVSFENINAYFDCLYFLYNVISLIILYCTNFEKQSRQIIFITVLLILTNAVSAFSNVYCLFDDELKSSKIRYDVFTLLHITAAAFTIYFHQPYTDSSEYVQVEEANNFDQDNDLNLDGISE
ncbi:hypothetical protein GPJ56_005376 [Histomonas meleagridis]|uniref:uncharacterized protein n=1 Tax=Histomonas meleagridis TaxID=135588 RepID=UPI00355AAF46|nr:hypothetical protein GPJ56_005376 [Histomonas meleagridis]KAH0796356.1 hypothetical protein GO595_010249 [Histomonas meleagridis]